MVTVLTAPISARSLNSSCTVRFDTRVVPFSTMIAWNNCCAGIDESTSGSVDRSGDEEMKKTEFTVSEVSHTSTLVVVVVQVYVMVPRGQALDASPLSAHERVPVPKSGTKSTTTVMNKRVRNTIICLHVRALELQQ